MSLLPPLAGLKRMVGMDIGCEKPATQAGFSVHCTACTGPVGFEGHVLAR
jgi:hypothetical protein